MTCCFRLERPYPYGDLSKDCQFHEETDFFVVDGNRYCRFHMPIKDMNGQSTGKLEWDGELESQFNDSISKIIKQNIVAENIIDLSGVQFIGSFDFTNIVREADPTSEAPHVLPPLLCVEAHFPKYANFSDLSFKEDTFFSDCFFAHEAYFTDSYFGARAKFFRSEFGPITDFEKAHFETGADFSEAVFDEGVSFHNAEFGLWTNFSDVHFLDNAEFSADSGAKPFQLMEFNNACFGIENNQTGLEEELYIVDFSGRVFSKEVEFYGAVFHSLPIFYGVTFHQSITIAEATFTNVKHYKAPRAYRSLKLAMQEQSSWNDMAKFYALEQKSVRHQAETKRHVKLMSWAYEAASDYGQSFVRPLFGLLLTIFVAFELYVFTLGVMGDSGDDQLILDVLLFGLKQMVKPFDAIVGGVDIVGLGGFEKFIFGTIATLQTLATAGFVTLFVLALRRRFRMA